MPGPEPERQYRFFPKVKYTKVIFFFNFRKTFLRTICGTSTSKKIIQETIDLDINDGITKLQRVHEYKYLRLTIDEDLNWKSHISSIAKKITPNLSN